MLEARFTLPRDSEPGHRLPVLALSAALGATWCLYLMGWRPLLPNSVTWLIHGEWAMGLLTWFGAREAAWDLPFGHQRSFLYPVGVSLAMGDGLPLFGAAFKLLAPLLPPVFQYQGLWFFICFVLQGVFGAKLLQGLTPNRLHQLLGAALFVASPVFNFRLGHIALSGHWLILAAMGLHFAPSDAAGRRRAMAFALLLVALAAGIQAYLLAMTLALCAALLMSWSWPHRLVTLPGLVARLVALGTVAVASSWGFGFLQGRTNAYGFSGYSANLLTFINPMGLSRVLGNIEVGADQYEGFGFVGTGVLLLFCFAVALAAWRRPRLPRVSHHRLPLIFVCLAMGLFSLSPRILFGKWTVLSYQALFDLFLGPLGESFRSPGRFVWPLCYLVTAAAVPLLSRLGGTRAAVTWMLALAAVVQLADFRAEDLRPAFTRTPTRPLVHDRWRPLLEGFRHLALVPPYVADGRGAACRPSLFAPDDVAALALDARLLKLTVNSGYVARIDQTAARAACDSLKSALSNGAVEDDTVYLVHPSQAARFATRAALVCGNIDADTLCISRRRKGPLREVLEGHPLGARPSEK